MKKKSEHNGWAEIEPEKTLTQMEINPNETDNSFFSASFICSTSHKFDR